MGKQRETTNTAIAKHLKKTIKIEAAKTDRDFCEVLEDLIIRGLRDANIPIAS
jgi:hypothetical protein